MEERAGEVEGMVDHSKTLSWPKRNFWKGKSVLLTGHTGFKGAWLAIWLHAMGARVFGYALDPPTTPNLFQAATVENRVTSYRNDIRDAQRLQQAVECIEPEIVMHLAAQSLVRESYNSPVDTYTTNVIGTVNLLEALRYSRSVRAVVIVTTDKCYANREHGTPFTENEPLGGQDPYSSSKACAELATAAWRASYFDTGQQRVAVATARAGNVIGGGIGPLTVLFPIFSGPYRRECPFALGTPMPFVLGSMSWSRSPAICFSPNSSLRTAVSTLKHGTSALPRRMR